MQFFLLFSLIGGVAYGSAIMKNVDDIQQQQDHQQQVHSVSDSVGQLQTFSSSQKNRLRPGPFYYPTYPEYSVAEYPAQQGYDSLPAPSNPNTYSSLSSGFMTDVLPLSSALLSYGLEAVTYFSHFALTVLLGAIITTLVCSFTPICTISFLGFGITNSQVKEQVADLARMYITPENLNTATILVTRALDKYTAMQHEKQDKLEKREHGYKNPNSTQISI